MPKPVNAKIPDDMPGFYEVNENFKTYIDKYCAKHKITKETAFTHKLINEIFKMYRTEAVTVVRVPG